MERVPASTDGSSVEGFSSGSVFGAQEFSARERDADGSGALKLRITQAEVRSDTHLCSRQQATEQ